MKRTWMWGWLGLVALTAQAEEVATYCVPGEQILESTKGCEDNRAFTDQAEACLDRLKAEIKRTGVTMPAGFSNNQRQQQTAKFSSSLQDYSVASQNLGRLIALTGQVSAEVDDYLDNVNLPEDTLTEDESDEETEAYVAKFPCYAETREAIENILDEIEDMKEDLENVKKVADAAAATSQGRRENLDATAGAVGRVTGGRGQSAPKVKGQKPAKDSDITGVKEDQKKRSQ